MGRLRLRRRYGRMGRVGRLGRMGGLGGLGTLGDLTYTKFCILCEIFQIFQKSRLWGPPPLARRSPGPGHSDCHPCRPPRSSILDNERLRSLVYSLAGAATPTTAG